VTVDLLRDELLSVPGVDSAVIEGEGLTPEGVRVRLAAGVDAAAVGEEVRRVLAAHGLRSEVSRTSAPITVEAPSMRSTNPLRPERRARETLATVSVVEGRDGITIRAETSSGRTADRAAWVSGERLDGAVVGAVSELAGVTPAPNILLIDDREVEGTPVVTIVVQDGRDRYAGSSVIEGGRPFALGQATWMALVIRDT